MEGHVARMGELRRIRNFGRKPERKNYLQNLGLDGNLVLEWILKEWRRGRGLDSSDKGQGVVAIPREHSI
jgi:hypothetical protein